LVLPEPGDAVAAGVGGVRQRLSMVILAICALVFAFGVLRASLFC
jgi:hypothetical protein